MSNITIDLGAYQVAKISVPEGLCKDPQWSMNGSKPRVLTLDLVSSMREPYENDKLRLVLTEDAQRDLVRVIQNNLAKEVEADV